MSRRGHTSATRERLNAALVAAFDANGEGAVITRDSVIIYTNDSFCAMTAMNEAELVGKPWPMELLAPDARDKAAAERQKFEDDPARQKRYRGQLIHKDDGGVVDVEVSVTTIDTGDGRLRVTLFRDVSREVALENQHRGLMQAGATANEGMGSLDAHGLITSWNAGAQDMLGMPQSVALNSHYSQLVPEDLLPHAYAVFSALMLRDQVTQFDFELRHTNGESVPVSIAAAPTSQTGDKRPGIAFLITPRATGPNDAQPSYPILREQASHELRTPLAIALGFLETLNARWESIDSEQRHHFVQPASASVERLFGTVERLLADAGIEHRTPSVTWSSPELTDTGFCQAARYSAS